MKVLFLDIDGVLNHTETFKKRPEMFFPIDQWCAFLAGKIQLDTECEIVLSSTWRKHSESVNHIKSILPLYDLTKDFSAIRGEEIKEWLDRHPEVNKYAILDDDSDMLPEQLPNFFQTSFRNGGLTEEMAKRVTAHLL